MPTPERYTQPSSRLSEDPEELERAALADFVRGQKGSIKDCYTRELKQQPSLRGRLTVRFSITPSGFAADLRLEEDTFSTPVVGACVLRVVGAWEFPLRPLKEVPVAYPFIFEPAG